MKKALVLILTALLVVSFCTVSFAEGKKFGATYMTMNNPFFGAMNEAIKKAVEANGDTLITLDPALDEVKQISQVEDMLAQGVSAIFLNPVDWQGVAPALLACKEAGVPIINVDAPVYDEEYVACIVASDNLSAGLICGEDMLKRIKGGKVVILEHPTAKSGVDRILKFDEIVKAHPEFTIAARQSSEGQLEIAMPSWRISFRPTPTSRLSCASTTPQHSELSRHSELPTLSKAFWSTVLTVHPTRRR